MVKITEKDYKKILRKIQKVCDGIEEYATTLQDTDVISDPLSEIEKILITAKEKTIQNEKTAQSEKTRICDYCGGTFQVSKKETEIDGKKVKYNLCLNCDAWLAEYQVIEHLRELFDMPESEENNE